ncbi:endonuclease NucS domain-containing protein [Rhodoplanes sp. SY1]|uniref:endonuclease NucS domain-containing protein n=1 Tax=Rhodoplanes sp. SY1 TaxID=3166646 RepID=UPI0038B438A1
MSIKRHFVVLPRQDGGIDTYPMKDWLRLHPERMPPNLKSNPTDSTSHKIRSELRKLGWIMEETPSEVRMTPPPGIDIGEGGSKDSEENEEPTFSFEYQLRDFIADNLSTININGKSLRLYEDDNGEGVEYRTAIGPIDILATDKDGSFYVFELKRANSHDRAIGQLARYMGWLKQTIGTNKDVFGVIVSKSVGNQLRFARTVVPNVFLFEYQISFNLKPAHEIPIGKKFE